MEIKIDRDIPVPQRTKYPWAEVKPGESFLVPFDSTKPRDKFRAQLSTRAFVEWGRGNFRTKIMDGGVRIWRLK